MRCNPWRWLWGLIPLALLIHVALLGEREAVEADLRARATDALAKSGIEWASVALLGRDVRVTGQAAADKDRHRAIDAIKKQWGVRAVEDRTELIALATDYNWAAALQKGRLRIWGHVPSESIRKAIIGTAKATFSGLEVQDRMQLARGAPDHDQWLGGVSFALRQLARLKGGAHASLAGTKLAIAGEAEDIAAYQSVKAALANGLPQGIGLQADKVMPPTVKPFVWAAARQGEQLELTGHVPDERQRDEIFEMAKRSFPSSAVVDRMSIAAGEPPGWRGAVGSALSELARLEEGRVELHDTQVSIAGLAANEQLADAVGKRLKSELPAAFKVSDQIKFKEPPAVKDDAEARRKAEAAARAAVEAEAKRKAEAAARAAVEAEAKRVADLERQRAVEEEAHRKKAEAEAEARRRKAEAEEEQRRKAAEAEARRQEELARCREAVGSVVGPGSVTFARASAELNLRSHATLDELASVIARCSGVEVEIAGHADAEGTPESKQRLSERRARAVFEYLSNVGVDAHRMTIVGYADTKPVAANDTEQNRAKNRRISISVKIN